MRNFLGTAWQQRRALLTSDAFAFGRPLVVFQSDDWARVGVRDREGWEELKAAGVHLGERNYDFYSLETAEDVEAITALLLRHRDSTGRPACLGMNFLLANVDFSRVRADNFRQVYLRPLNEGLPEDWNRPGLLDAYHTGIGAGVLSPALHGTTHFCRGAVERYLRDPGDRGALLRTFWRAGVPYIHWRMPWVGFEYSDITKNGREVFLKSEVQERLISEAVTIFTKLFSKPPQSACAPGYRADRNTQAVWARHGVRVAQNGPSARAPHFETNRDRNGGGQNLLHLYRTVDFEPSAGDEFSVDGCLRSVENSFARGVPAIISVHSINFQSMLKDFRAPTLKLLDEFLSALEAKYPDLLYVRDEDLYSLVETGRFESAQSTVSVRVTKRGINDGRK